MAALSDSKVARSKSPSYELKPVLGEGRETRWESFEKIVKEKIVPIYGSQDSLLKKIKDNTSDYKSRLFYIDEQAKGVLVYKTTTSDLHDRKGYPQSIEICSLYAENESEYTHLLNTVIESVKDTKCESLSIKVDRKVTELIKFLENNKFKEIDRTYFTNVYARRLIGQEPPKEEKKSAEVSNGTGKKRRLEEPTPTPEKKQRGEDKPDQRTPVAVPVYRTPPHRLAPERLTPYSGESYGKEVDRIPPIISSRKIAEARGRIESTERRPIDCPIMRNYFFMIQRGQKTVEGRINTGMFARLRVGDLIRFKNKEDFVVCEITNLNPYKSFAEMLKTEGVKPCLPDVYELNAAIAIYDRIPGYAEKASRFGVLAIHVKISQ